MKVSDCHAEDVDMTMNSALPALRLRLVRFVFAVASAPCQCCVDATADA
jgi:hypothetical protein